MHSRASFAEITAFTSLFPFSRSCIPLWLLLVKKESMDRPLVLVSGFIHDVSVFMDQHPGGRELLAKAIGTDATTAFFGGTYEHSHAAHNVRPISLVPCSLCLFTRYRYRYRCSLIPPHPLSSDAA